MASQFEKEKGQTGREAQSMLNRLEQRIDAKRLDKNSAQEAIATAVKGIVEAKKIIGGSPDYFETKTPDVFMNLSNAWYAWLDNGIFQGPEHAELRTSLQSLLTPDGNTAAKRYARQLFRTEMVSYIAEKLLKTKRADKAHVMERVMGAQVVSKLEDEPIEALTLSMYLDPEIRSRAKREELASKMEKHGVRGNLKNIPELFKNRTAVEIKVVTGGALFTVHPDLAVEFNFKNMVLDGDRIYAQMENGCKGNLVIIEVVKWESAAPRPLPKQVPKPEPKPLSKLAPRPMPMIGPSPKLTPKPAPVKPAPKATPPPEPTPAPKLHWTSAPELEADLVRPKILKQKPAPTPGPERKAERKYVLPPIAEIHDFSHETPEYLRTSIQRLEQFGLKQGEYGLIADAATQTLFAIRNRKVERAYPISTSRDGVGHRVEPGNWNTPPGMLKVKGLSGKNRKLGQAVGDGKFPKIWQPGEHVPRGTHGDILTRAIYLTTAEPGVNMGEGMGDFRIMIHGTAREDEIGKPASKGCIRMRNTDVVDVFDLVKHGTPIDVLNRDMGSQINVARNS